MQIPLVAGRFFTQDDLGKNVAVISARAAQIAWHGQNPIGQLFRRGDPDDKPFQVIGIVGDVRAIDLSKQPPAMVYVPLTYRSNKPAPSSSAPRMIPPRCPTPSAKPSGASTRQVAVPEVRTMATIVDGSLAARNFQLHLLLAFAGLRARARRARHLRRRRLLRNAAHARARHPHRARRAARADL